MSLDERSKTARRRRFALRVWCPVLLASGMLPLTFAIVNGARAPISNLAHAFAASDQITLLNASAADMPVVVLDGRAQGGACLQDNILTGLGPFTPANLVAPTSACPSEVAVFSRQHAMVLRSDPPWTTATNTLVIDLALEPLVPVPLNVWIASGSANAEDHALADIAKALSLFDDNRVGITFTEVDTFKRALKTSADPVEKARAEAIGNGCGYAHRAKRVGEPVYSAAKINVYYVPTVDGDFFRGYNCAEYGAPNIIYISVAHHSTTTLAHELGHAFGLFGDNGHTDERAGFDENNIMQAGLDATASEAQDSFSLGQAYRMNVHGGSWLNQVVVNGASAGPTRPSGDTRGCQDRATTTWPCPRLNKAFP